MALIRPFRAIRPREDLVSEVAALPYDVYSSGEAREAVKGHPLSFLNIDRAETQFPEGTDIYSGEVYEKAGGMLRDWIRKGVLVQEGTPCYYLYALTMNGHTETGIAACSSVDDYLSGVIRRHENTRAEKEEDRLRHISTTSMQTGPIFLAYRNRPEIDRLTAEICARTPLYDFVSKDGVWHAVWRVEDPDEIQRITAAFSEVPFTYIADGHHRAASAVRAGSRI